MKKIFVFIFIACALGLSACSNKNDFQNKALFPFETRAVNISKNGQLQKEGPRASAQTQNPPKNNKTQNENFSCSKFDPYNSISDGFYKGPPSAVKPSLEHFSDFPVFDEPEFSDYDFSSLSKTMVYGFVYDVLSNAENYAGKFLKLKGSYKPYHTENGETYHFLIIYDENACCEMAMELLPTKGSSPAFPEPGDEIEASGIVDICNDGGARFVALRINGVSLVK